MKLQVLTFLGFITVGSGDVFTHEESEDIKGYLETMMGCHNIPGLTIAVIKGNDSWTLPLGYADTAAKRAVTDETLFGIGSITKSITATLIAVMIDESEGKITFDTPVSELLGVGYQFPDDFQTRETTIKDVLSHRTGIAALNLAMLFGIPPGISREDFSKLVGMMTSKPFRGEMLYSNFMYMLAGHITEKVWGASWEENLKTKLFQKIGMASTEAISGDADITGDKYARPYVYLRGEVVEGDPSPFDISTVGPAGGLATNIKDKVKFMRFMLNKGKLENGTQLIKEATLQQLWQPVIPLPPFVVFMMERLSPQWPVADISTGYGMGWFKNVYRV
ncbi:penicillin-binding protein 4-like isoform X2 [Haliotis rufescens]|uniref:penicillin-binding protein 4-like isoform X2 n=1 Tax=Haliotis rufescens TaxID=6454 RepID=UPI00201FA767|nr:penicillin-binding protein 4-like isoform X2 [Haliotis rufescens]